MTQFKNWNILGVIKAKIMNERWRNLRMHVFRNCTYGGGTLMLNFSGTKLHQTAKSELPEETHESTVNVSHAQFSPRLNGKTCLPGNWPYKVTNYKIRHTSLAHVTSATRHASCFRSAHCADVNRSPVSLLKMT